MSPSNTRQLTDRMSNTILSRTTCISDSSLEIKHGINCFRGHRRHQNHLSPFSRRICLLVVRGNCFTPCSSRVHLPMVLSNGSTHTSIGTQPSLPSLSCFDPIKSCSITWILRPIWSRTPMTRSE